MERKITKLRNEAKGIEKAGNGGERIMRENKINKPIKKRQIDK
jgi:hypothetical protein